MREKLHFSGFSQEFHLPENNSFSFQLSDFSTKVRLSRMLAAMCNLSEVGESLLKSCP